MSTRARAKNVKNNAIFMILLIIADPVMTLQTGLLARDLQNSPELEDNPVGKHFNLGNAIGVQGTPSIITDQGKMIPGYLPPEDLLNILSSSG